MNSAPLSREQIRRQKATERKIRTVQKVERKKGWLAEHPEVALSIQREKEIEAEKRHALWLENEEKRKQLSAQVKKKMPANAFAALIGDETTDEEISDDEVKTQELAPPELISDGESTEDEAAPAPKITPEEAVRAKYTPMNNSAKKSWADIMDEDE